VCLGIVYFVVDFYHLILPFPAMQRGTRNTPFIGNASDCMRLLCCRWTFAQYNSMHSSTSYSLYCIGKQFWKRNAIWYATDWM